MQVLVVGQDGVRSGAEEVVVPDAEQRQDTGRFSLQRRVRKCSSIAWAPASSSSKRSMPTIERDRQADRRPQRVAAADPVPEPEHVGGVDAELARPPPRWSRGRRSASRPPPRRRRAVQQPVARASRALVIVSCVVKVLEATMNSVRSGSSPRSVSARCVPSTLETKCSAQACGRRRASAPRSPSPGRGRSRRCRC